MWVVLALWRRETGNERIADRFQYTHLVGGQPGYGAGLRLGLLGRRHGIPPSRHSHKEFAETGYGCWTQRSAQEETAAYCTPTRHTSERATLAQTAR